MARLARLVIPGLPHHVTQRGTRRQQTFFNDGDYAAYLERMAQWCGAQGVDVWAYCLMPNHVHVVVVPRCEEALGPMGARCCTVPSRKKSCGRSKSTFARVNSAEPRRFCNVWSRNVVACSVPRSQAVHARYSNNQNRFASRDSKNRKL